MEPRQGLEHVAEALVALEPAHGEEDGRGAFQRGARRAHHRQGIGRGQPGDLFGLDAVRDHGHARGVDADQAGHLVAGGLVGRDHAVGEPRRLARQSTQPEEGDPLEPGRLVLLQPLGVHHQRRAQRAVRPAAPAVAERTQPLGVDHVHASRPHHLRDHVAHADREAWIAQRPIEDAAVAVAAAVGHGDDLAGKRLVPRSRARHQHRLHSRPLQSDRQVVDGRLHPAGRMKRMRGAAEQRHPHRSLR